MTQQRIFCCLSALHQRCSICNVFLYPFTRQPFPCFTIQTGVLYKSNADTRSKTAGTFSAPSLDPKYFETSQKIMKFGGRGEKKHRRFVVVMEENTDTTATLPRIHDLCKPTICCRGVHYTITNESDCLYGRLQYHTHTLLSSQGLMCTMDEVTESTAELLSPTLSDLNAPLPAYTHAHKHTRTPARTMSPVHCPRRRAASESPGRRTHMMSRGLRISLHNV